MKSAVEEVPAMEGDPRGVISLCLSAVLPLILAACVPAPLGKYYKPIYEDPTATYSGDSCGGKAGAPAALAVTLPDGVVLSVNAWRSYGERDQSDRPLHLSIAVPKGVQLQFTSDEVRIGGDVEGAIRVIKPPLQVSASLVVPADTFVDLQKMAPTSFSISNGRQEGADFSGSAGFSFSWRDDFVPDAVRLELPGIEVGGEPGAKRGPIALTAYAKKRPDSYPGQYKSNTSLIYATQESQQELARRFEACTKDTPHLKCNQILLFDEARFRADQEGYRYSGRIYLFDVENHSPFSVDLSVKFDDPRPWRFATNTISAFDTSSGEVRKYRFDEVPLNFAYKVPLGTRVTGVNNSPNGGQTKVGFSVNLGDREPSRFTIELPTVLINDVLYQFKVLELERRMFDVGLEPFNC